MPSFNKSLFIFRRDLRLVDNTALNLALKNSRHVYPVFFLDPRQLENNDYYSANAVEFLQKSLLELNQELEKINSGLNVFRMKSEDYLNQQAVVDGIEAVFFNYDYTPFSKSRDQAIKDVCQQKNIKFFPAHDLMLHAPGQVLKDNAEPYSVFTYYRKKAEQFPITSPQTAKTNNFSPTLLPNADLGLLKQLVAKNNPELLVTGGRKQALQILNKLPTSQAYQQERDFPAIHSSTKLSAHLKFGTISAREAYQQLAKIDPSHLLISQLHWRDFFTQISFFYPTVYGQAFQRKYDNVEWSYSEEHFRKWCLGMTGFPIVDAGMRELNHTGYMHNRVRMVVASFLTKNLQIDWRWGEKYFASKLTDYDPALNNGNWQWAASTGCDAQPYFRIFNPWTQQKKFDAEAIYIKQWVKELQHLSAKQIHNEEFLTKQVIPNYPQPMVQHSAGREAALDMFHQALSSKTARS